MKRISLFAVIFAIIIFFNTPLIIFADVDGSTTVYITETGQKYHRGNCSYLRQSKISITLSDATAMGYTPCSRCNPPRYSQSMTKSSSFDSSDSTSATTSQTHPVIWFISGATFMFALGKILGCLKS